MVKLAHKKGMLVMGYFCVAANSKWGKDHPDLSYGTPSTLHIPFTDEYLDYLSRSMGDAMKKTGMDGTMIDWVWNPDDKPAAERVVAGGAETVHPIDRQSFSGERTAGHGRKAGIRAEGHQPLLGAHQRDSRSGQPQMRPMALRQ